MPMTRTLRLLTCAALAGLLLTTACGQRGPLYLPPAEPAADTAPARCPGRTCNPASPAPAESPTQENPQ